MFNDETPYKVSFKWHTQETLKELSNWCHNNCVGKHQYQYTAPNFWFELEQDAIMFRLSNNL